MDSGQVFFLVQVFREIDPKRRNERCRKLLVAGDMARRVNVIG